MAQWITARQPFWPSALLEESNAKPIDFGSRVTSNEPYVVVLDPLANKDTRVFLHVPGGKSVDIL